MTVSKEHFVGHLIGPNGKPQNVEFIVDRRYVGGSTINTQDGDYTLILTDTEKTIHKAAGGAGETITIPANSVEPFAIGTMIAFQNDGGGDLSIAITTDTLTGTDGATGTRTLGNNHTAVIQKVTATSWKYAASDL